MGVVASIQGLLERTVAAAVGAETFQCGGVRYDWNWRNGDRPRAHLALGGRDERHGPSWVQGRHDRDP
jgi:hypothetical protein